MTIDTDIRSLNPGALVELFELDATSLGGTITRVHAGTNGLRTPVVWQGNTYTPFPVEASGFDYSGKGQLPRPTLRIANVTGAVGVLVRDYGDLQGAKVTRRRTLAKYLDAVNFPAQRNLFLSSDALTATGWVKTQATAGTGTALTQRGTASQSLVENTAAAIGHYVSRSIAFTSGQDYTITAAAAERAGSAKRYLALVFPSAAFGANRGGVFDLAAGTFVAINGAACSMVKLPTGGYRCSATYAATATASGGPQVRLSNLPGNLAPSYTGDGTSGLDVWDIQIEQASAATEYQPTGTTWSANPTADPTAQLPDEVYYIDRKATENKVVIEFELAAAFDVAGVQLPRRAVVQNVCPWKYRVADESSGCTYIGTNYFDASDNAVASAGQDVCGKRLTSCKLRHGVIPLPFGGFPGAGLTR